MEPLVRLYFDGIIPNHIYPLLEEFNFEMSNFQDCDYLISCKFYAETTSDPKIIQSNLSYYEKIYKKVIVFLICDWTNEFDIPYNVLLFRTSLYKTKKHFNEFLLPYVWEEITEPFKVLKKTKKPIVGFCGRVDQHREKLINGLENNEHIEKNFILKKEYWGGNPHNINLIEQFTKNVILSHFTVCNRGNGNYSMRFYQVLSAGRIPVLIDTDLIFPFEDKINWRKIIIIGSDENEVINMILKWWAKKDIEEIQRKCKEVYETYFNRKNFLKIIFDGFCEKNKNNNFSFPHNFDPNVYGKYKDLHGLNMSNLVKHYIEHGKLEGRLYKLPINFDLNFYRKYNRDLVHLGNDQLIEHYIYNGRKEKRIYCSKMIEKDNDVINIL